MRRAAVLVISFLASVTTGAQTGSLWTAAREGDLPGVNAAIARGTPIDAVADDGTTPLFIAAQNGHDGVVDLLAARGANVNVVGPVNVGGQSYRINALEAAGLRWHVDVARVLLKRGVTPPKYLQDHHELVPYAASIVDTERDWEVIGSVLRMPELEPIMRAIVRRDAEGTYRTHDGREYRAAQDQDGVLHVTTAEGSTLTFEPVGGKAFMQVLPGDRAASQPNARPRSERELTMIGRFLEPLPDQKRAALVDQFAERGGIWLDFTVGEDRVLGLEIREGGPARLGGTPTVFTKVGVRQAVSSLFEREIAAARGTPPPLNWPSFRGASAAGVADGQYPPTSWSATTGTNIRWKTAIPGLGNSSPIVWGDRIFVTTAVSSIPNPEFRPGGLRTDNVSNDRSSQTWKLFSLDKQTGKVVWERTIHTGVPRLGRHLKSTYATSTPATDGRHVIVALGSEGLYSYDLDGNLQWRKDLGVVGHATYGFSSSPVIYRDVVIVQGDTNGAPKQATPTSFIAAFDLADGRERWRTPRNEDGRSSSGSPIIYDGLGPTLVVTNGGERVRAYDPLTGKEVWSLAAPSEIVTPTPVVGHNLIYITSGNSGYQPIFAIRPTATGDITLKAGEERNEFVVWSSNRGGSFTSTPIVYGDYLYLINVSGIVGCYDAKTGERKYTGRLNHLGAGFSSSPVAADGRLYFASEDGDVFVVRAGPEFELLASNPMDEVIMATPAVSGGMLLIRTLHHLVAVGYE